MAIDLEAIRRRMAQLSGDYKTSSIQFWKPGPGEYKVRALPWKENIDGQPFKELWFYYLGKFSGMLTLKQFNEPDPINDLISKLFKSGKPEDKELAKALLPKMRTYAPVIVRGQEDLGVQLWAFGKTVHQRLLSFYFDEDLNDILDPHEGHDLRVSITKQAGKTFNNTVVDARPKAVPLSTDPEQMKKWLDSIPNLNDAYKKKSAAELEDVLNKYLNGEEPEPWGGSPSVVVDTSDGTSKTSGESSSDELDNLVNDIKEKKATKKTKKVSDESDDEVAVSKSTKKSLDEAFEDLMEDD